MLRVLRDSRAAARARRLCAVWLALAAVAVPVAAIPRAAAQAETGVICVATFTDLNADGRRDADEGPLAGVNVNLSTGGAIIATHITEEGEAEYCFERLLRGIYTVTFTESPLYRITTPREGTFALDAGQRLTIDAFGAFPIGPAGLRAEMIAQASAAQQDRPLDTSTRLLLATGGAAVMMMFMVGLGAVMIGLLDWRQQRRQRRQRQRRQPVPPPPIDWLRPPDRT